MTAWHGAQKTEVVAHFVGPSPAAHAILTALKAGESVFQTLLLTKQWFMHIEEHKHCFMHYFGVKTLSEMSFPPP